MDQLPSRNPVRYVAPMLQLWLNGLERTLLPWAMPLVLGLLTLVLGLIVLMLLTRSPISHVLRMLTPAMLVLRRRRRCRCPGFGLAAASRRSAGQTV